LERSNSLTGRNKGSATLGLVPTLLPSQVVIIRRSWKHINVKGLNEVIRRCFQKLESARAKASYESKHLQPGTSVETSSYSLPRSAPKCLDIAEHTKYFHNLLVRIIETNEEVDMELKMVGARHAILNGKLCLGVAEIESLGELLAEALLKLDGINQSKETSRAWRLLITKIIDHIRDGFETEIRFRRRKIGYDHGCVSVYDESIASSPEDRRKSLPSQKNIIRLEITKIARKLSHL